MNKTSPNNKEELVSIIIPVFNRKEMCKEAIYSALSQNYSNIEVVVGDNCSTDGTFEYLMEEFALNRRVILFRNKENLGPVGNWKECLAHCSGEYVKILWSDDLMAPSFIKESVEVFRKYKNVSFVYSSVLFFEHYKDTLDKCFSLQKKAYCMGESGVKEGKDFIVKSFSQSYSIPVSPGCAIFRRQKIRIENSIPNRIAYDHNRTGAGTDLLIFYNSILNGEQYYFISTPLNYFRVHGGSISCADNTINRGYWTAKLYFLSNNRAFDFCKEFLISEMVSSVFSKLFFRKPNIFQKKRVEEFLSAYFDAHSVSYSKIKTIVWELKRRNWYKKNV